MKDKKVILIIIVSILGIFAFIFWIFFGVISYRRAIYYYEGVAGTCSRDQYQLFYKKDGVRYFSACYDEVMVVEKRFIFNYRYNIKKYIDEGSLLRILQKVPITKWAYNDILHTDYSVPNYSEDGNMTIVKCQIDNKTDYYFVPSMQVNQSFCRYFYQ